MIIRKDFGFDLGTSYMHICQKEKGVILAEPEVIAIDRNTNNIYAVGDEAYEMFEKAPENIHVSMPVKYGVIADFDNMLNLLDTQLKNLHINKCTRAYAIVCVPYSISEVERRALYDVFIRSKAKFRKVFLLEKPLAAGIGCGIDVLEPSGNMIVDIGGETTEISIVSLGGVVISDLIKIGGRKFDENIKNYVKRKYNAYIGLKTSEKIKKNIGAVLDEDKESSVNIIGRDVITGLPKKIAISDEDVYNAIKDDINMLIDSIKYILEKTPPEISGDILNYGIHISGGTANIKDIGRLISKETHLKVNINDEPSYSVINGVNTILNDYEKHRSILFTPKE